jgi:hypothetical protein
LSAKIIVTAASFKRSGDINGEHAPGTHRRAPPGRLDLDLATADRTARPALMAIVLITLVILVLSTYLDRRAE